MLGTGGSLAQASGSDEETGPLGHEAKGTAIPEVIIKLALAKVGKWLLSPGNVMEMLGSWWAERRMESRSSLVVLYLCRPCCGTRTLEVWAVVRDEELDVLMRNGH